jgi:UDP-GlcNAc:undecaprenyl-phosphate GlcNAc-1-phosphate transferase
VYGKAITAGTIVPILILLFMYRFYSFSRAVFVIYWGLMLLMVSLSRLSFRLLDEGIRKGNRSGNRVLIYGAGLGGQMTMREIETNNDLGMILAGFMDDNPSLRKRKIRGYPVFGGMADLREVIKKRGIKEIIISFREKSTEKKTEIRNLCSEMEIDMKIKEMKLRIE